MEGDDDKVGIHGRFATLIGRRPLPVEPRDKTKVPCKGWKKEGIEGKIISGWEWRPKGATNSTSVSTRVSKSIFRKLRRLFSMIDFLERCTTKFDVSRSTYSRLYSIPLISFESKARETRFQERRSIAAFYRGLTVSALSIGYYRQIRETRTSFDVQRDSRHGHAKRSFRRGRSDRFTDQRFARANKNSFVTMDVSRSADTR